MDFKFNWLRNFFYKKSHKKSHKKSGETILEVLIAITILSSVLIATYSNLNQAFSTNINVRNRVIAMNIAQEGLEAVRNIRDTNWLKYSGDRRSSWLCLDVVGANTCNAGAAATITDAKYIVSFSPANGRYYLVETIGLSTDTPPDAGAQEILNIDVALTDWSEYRLYKDVNSRYLHDNTGANITPFFRQIELAVENPYDGTIPLFCNDGTGDGIDDLACKNARLKVISRVQWREDNGTHEMVLEHHLFDYYERDEY